MIVFIKGSYHYLLTHIRKLRLREVNDWLHAIGGRHDVSLSRDTPYFGVWGWGSLACEAVLGTYLGVLRGCQEICPAPPIKSCAWRP